ncbi:MAG: hypothetical protein E7484_01900 [Ruminococcaceae bacterium]|nr:hypothetical protein [Oscillospiraceae bacterium]
MSVSTQIERLQADRNTIRTKLIELGLVQTGANLTACAAAIEGVVKRGAVDVEIKEGTSYTIPAGYHNGSGVVKAITDTAGEAEKYKTQAKGPITPTKKQQSITPDEGYYALSAVTVDAIPAEYQDVSSVTATKDDVLVGKIFVDSLGNIITGEMSNNGAAGKTLDVTTISYTIPKGYHSGTGKVNIVLEEKTVVPKKTVQTITPADGKVLSKVTVSAIPDEYITTNDADAVAADILAGKTAYVNGVKVTGEMLNNGAVNEKISNPGSSQLLNGVTFSYAIPKGYHDGNGKVEVVAETARITPVKDPDGNSTVLFPTTTNGVGAFFDKVVVESIPPEYITTDDADAVAANLLKDKTAYVDGVKVTGSMPNNGKVTAAIEGLTAATSSYTIPAGYHNGSGTVSLTGDIEEALAAI